MKKIRFNKDWEFRVGGGSSLEALMPGGTFQPQKVTLPHDASITKERNPQEPGGSGNGFFREENYHYTKEFSLKPEDYEKSIWLEFEGVYQNAFVYVNNAYVGKCAYGYSNFYLDITNYVSFADKNVVKVIVKNGVPSGRWYTGGGIYRDVNLMIGDMLHILPDGVRLSVRDAEQDLAVLCVETDLEYSGRGNREVTLIAQLYDGEGRLSAEDKIPVMMEANSKKNCRQILYVRNPLLWDDEHPELYRYRIRIEENGNLLDEEEGAYGIRKLQLDRFHGLRVNGRSIKLRGGCIHHDNGVIGTAEFESAAMRRIERLKMAGYNAIRSSHYPMSRRLLDACDRCGMYVMDEFSDVWTTTKVDFDYGVHLTEWWEHDITNMVKKDYNHPCVIMYSIGNEIPEIGNKFGAQWSKKFSDKIRSLDSTRYVTNGMNLLLGVMDSASEILAQELGIGSDMESMQHSSEINSLMSNLGELMNVVTSSKMAGDKTSEAASHLDIIGYNYSADRYEKEGEEYPNRILVGSETYPGDLDRNWELVEKLDYVIGDFAWTAWDYLGETGIGMAQYGEGQDTSFYVDYPCKAAYCGDFNLIGDRRPVSYWREMIWGMRCKPYIAVRPPMYHDKKRRMPGWCMTDAVRSWNWEGYEGSPITVEVYGIGDEAALYLNGKLLEQKKIGSDKKAQAIFETIYDVGRLETVVYLNGVEQGRDCIMTASEPCRMEVNAGSDKISADEDELCYVEISLLDQGGNLNPEKNREVTAVIDGPGVLLGFGSADPNSEENYFDNTARTYEGRLLAVIRGTGQTGQISLTLCSEGMDDVSVIIQAV